MRGELRIEGETVRVYGLAKTLVDPFKYRTKIGLDVCLKAPREAWRAPFHNEQDWPLRTCLPGGKCDASLARGLGWTSAADPRVRRAAQVGPSFPSSFRLIVLKGFA